MIWKHASAIVCDRLRSIAGNKALGFAYGFQPGYILGSYTRPQAHVFSPQYEPPGRQIRQMAYTCYKQRRKKSPLIMLTWAKLLEASLVLTSVKYHDNLLVSILLTQWLVLTRSFPRNLLEKITIQIYIINKSEDSLMTPQKTLRHVTERTYLASRSTNP